MYGAIVVPCNMIFASCCIFYLLVPVAVSSPLKTMRMMRCHLSRDALESKVLLHEGFMCELKRLHAACGTL